MLAGLACGNCMMPMKFIRHWQWENLWLVFSVVSLCILPWGLALLLVGDVRPIYAGSYVDTLTKAVTATKAGQGPQMAVVLAVDAYSLVDDELILPFDTLATAAEDKAWLASFYPSAIFGK